MNKVSVKDLGQNTTKIIESVKVSNEPVIVTQRSKPLAVLVNPTFYKVLEEALEDMLDLRAIEVRKDEPTITLDEFLRRFFKEDEANKN